MRGCWTMWPNRSRHLDRTCDSSAKRWVSRSDSKKKRGQGSLIRVHIQQRVLPPLIDRRDKRSIRQKSEARDEFRFDREPFDLARRRAPSNTQPRFNSSNSWILSMSDHLTSYCSSGLSSRRPATAMPRIIRPFHEVSILSSSPG